MNNEDLGGRTAAVSVQPMAVSRSITTRSVASGDGQIPENVSQLWERLELHDSAMVLFLESIVRSVRLDGSAPIAEVITRYATARSGTDFMSDRITSSTDVARDSEELRREVLDSLLPSLAAAGMIALPVEGTESSTASLTISHPWLRLALLEAGLIQLNPETDGAETLPARAGGYVPAASPADSAPNDEWSQLWFAVQRYEWSTLAVVAASPGTSGAEAAHALVAAGRMYTESGLELIDATNVTPATVERIITSMSGAVARGSQLVVALDSPLANPSAIPIARHANIALLAVRLGVASVEATQRAIGVIGRDSFVGSVALK